MVDIDIIRNIYTNESILSTLRVTSTKIQRTFQGYALENARAGAHYEKHPIPPGIYHANVRTDGHLGWRIELLQVPGHTHIEIHIGNYPSNSHGCFLPGKTKAANAVGHSADALREIRAIIDADGSGAIVVHVSGGSTKS